MNSVIIKPKKDKAIRHRHPWIFSGAVQEVIGNPHNGETVEIYDSKHEFLGMGAYSPNSQIRLRMWSFKKEQIDREFFVRKIQASCARREILKSQSEDNAWRLIHAESDLLPGLIVDQYDQILVVQILSSGVEAYRDEIFSALREVTGLTAIYERSDVEVRRLEGLQERVGVISGDVPDEVVILEGGLKFNVQIKNGQKTGFYLDQRDNRKIFSEYCKGKDVLNMFAFTGGFSIYAASHGARSVLSVDSSTEAIQLARQNMEINHLNYNPDDWVVADAFQYLRKLINQKRYFDIIILDPPKFAASASQVEKAARGYKDINLSAFRLLNPRGYLITFSCSGSLTESLFQKIVADAALDAGVDASILQRLHQGADHPVGLNFPEGAYLKGLICRRD